MFSAQALMNKGQFTLTSQSCLGFFIIPPIKWAFLSLFISFPSESPGWHTCSTWQKIKENFLWYHCARRELLYWKEKERQKANSSNTACLEKLTNPAGRKFIALCRDLSWVIFFFCLSDKKYHANSPKLLGNYRRYAWQIPCHYTTQ